MSNYRTPLLPAPRTEIWLTHKNPWLSIFLALVAGIFICIVSIFVITAIFMNPPSPSPSITSNPTVVNQQATKTKIPLTKARSTPTISAEPSDIPTSDIWKDCKASYKSRLKVGDTAYVSNTPPLSNRLRAGPSKSESVIGHIDPGEKIEILKGPSCANNWVWWRVKSLKDGEIGWTSEGDVNNYWLVPQK